MSFGSNLSHTPDDQIITRLEQRADALFEIDEPLEEDLLKLKRCLNSITAKLVENFDYHDVFLTYLNVFENYKRKLYESDNISLFNNFFVDLTLICGEVLKVKNLWRHAAFVAEFIDTWNSLTRSVSNSLKLYALHEYKEYFDKLVSVMAQIGNFNIQRSIFELIIRYSCTQFNEISKPIIIDIFESNGFLDIENALAEFNFQTLRQSIRLLLNKFNDHAENVVTSVLAETITLKGKSLQLVDLGSCWIDFNQGTQSISLTFKTPKTGEITDATAQISFDCKAVSEVRLQSFESGTKLISTYKLRNAPNVEPAALKPHLSQIRMMVLAFSKSTDNFDLMSYLVHNWFSSKMLVDETACIDLNSTTSYVKSTGVFLAPIPKTHTDATNYDETTIYRIGTAKSNMQKAAVIGENHNVTSCNQEVLLSQTETDLNEEEAEDEQNYLNATAAETPQPPVANSFIIKTGIHENMMQEEYQPTDQIPEMNDDDNDDDIEIDIDENLLQKNIQLLHDNSFGELLEDKDPFDGIKDNSDLVMKDNSTSSPNSSSESVQTQAESPIQSLSENSDKIEEESENIEDPETSNNQSAKDYSKMSLNSFDEKPKRQTRSTSQSMQKRAELNLDKIEVCENIENTETDNIQLVKGDSNKSSPNLFDKTPKRQTRSTSQSMQKQSESVNFDKIEESENIEEIQSHNIQPMVKVRDLSLFARRDDESEESECEEPQTITVTAQIHTDPSEIQSPSVSPRPRRRQTNLNTINFDKIEMYGSPKMYKQEDLNADYLYAKKLQQELDSYQSDSKENDPYIPDNSRYQLRKRNIFQYPEIQEETKSVIKKPRGRKPGISSKRKPSDSLVEYEMVKEDPLERNANKTASFSYRRFAGNEQASPSNDSGILVSSHDLSGKRQRKQTEAGEIKNSSREKQIRVSLEKDGYKSDSSSDHDDFIAVDSNYEEESPSKHYKVTPNENNIRFDSLRDEKDVAKPKRKRGTKVRSSTHKTKTKVSSEDDGFKSESSSDKCYSVGWNDKEELLSKSDKEASASNENDNLFDSLRDDALKSNRKRGRKESKVNKHEGSSYKSKGSSYTLPLENDETKSDTSSDGDEFDLLVRNRTSTVIAKEKPMKVYLPHINKRKKDHSFDEIQEVDEEEEYADDVNEQLKRLEDVVNYPDLVNGTNEADN